MATGAAGAMAGELPKKETVKEHYAWLTLGLGSKKIRIRF